ncbi:MAG: SET domain-containing protein-lysine N-methyltransferase [Spirochaetota bacterium]
MKNGILYQSKDFIVKPSNIPHSGYGLFARRSFAKGEVLGPYKGRLISEAEGQKLEDRGVDCSHMLDITAMDYNGGFAYIHPPKKMLLGYINHAPVTVKGKKIFGKKAYNVIFDELTSEPYVQITATKTITAGDEVYLNYGAYFSRLYLKTEKAKQFYLG